jgi:hypothetical protein
MLRWIILAVVVVVLSAAATFLVQYGPMTDVGPSSNLAVNEISGPQPKLEIAETLTHEFGAMAQQDKGTHAWVIKNVGVADLELKLLSSTCSCTIAKLRGPKGGESKTVVIPPGDSTTIDLEWETRTGPTDYHKSATIGTNDPTRPSFALHVKGKVFPPVMIAPPEMIVFSGISNEEPARAARAVISMDRPSMKVTKVTTSRPDFIVAKIRSLTEQERTNLRVPTGDAVDVEIKPGLPVGQFHEEMVIETDHPKQSEIKVSITGNATGPISVVPEKLRMTDVLSREGKTQNLTMLVRGALATHFEVAHSPSHVEVSIPSDDSEARKGRYRLKVTVPPGSPAGLIEDEIILKTDNPKASMLKIPVTIVVSNVGAS